MLAADLSRVVAMSAMAVAAFTGASPVVVYVLAGFMAVASKTFRPAQAALLPLLAESPEELTAANVTSTAIESVGAFVGPALGGLLLAVAERRLGLRRRRARRSSGRRSSSSSSTATAEPPPPSVSARRACARSLAGFSALGSERDARVIVFLYFCQTIVAGALRVLIVVTALDLLDIGNSGLGFLNAAIGVGGLHRRRGRVRLVGRQAARRGLRPRARPDRRRARPDRRLADRPRRDRPHRRLRDREHARRRLRRHADAARRAGRGARPRLRRARRACSCSDCALGALIAPLLHRRRSGIARVADRRRRAAARPRGRCSGGGSRRSTRARTFPAERIDAAARESDLRAAAAGRRSSTSRQS